MNTEQLLEILKLRPANKLEIWDQMKTLSLSRFLSSVVSSVLLLVVLKVKMNIVGAYLFAVMSSKENAKSADFDISPLDPSQVRKSNFGVGEDGDPVLTDEESTEDANDEVNTLQLRYLNNIRYFVEKQLPILLDDCEEIVERQLSKVKLKDKLNHDQLKEICEEVLMKLRARHTTLNSARNEFCAYLVDPGWAECDENLDIYSQLMNDTTKVLESIDCSLVVDKCLQFGLEQALDNFADSFRTTVVPAGEVSVDDCLTNDFVSKELHVAKIIPILNNQIHELFKVGPNKFLDVLFSQDLLRKLSRSVYENTIQEYSLDTC